MVAAHSGVREGSRDLAPERALIRLCDLAGRPRGTGFLADADGTMITSHEAVDGLARLVLHAPGGQVCLVEASAVTPLPEQGLALVATEGLDLPLLPVAPSGPAHPERRMRLRLSRRTEGSVVGTTAATYAATDRFHLIGEVYELALDRADFDGQGAYAAASRGSGAPVLDAATGAVLGVVVTALYAGHRAGGFAVPLRAQGAPPPLAELLARNAETVPAFGPHLNLAGALRLTGTSVASAAGPGPACEPVERPEVADALGEFLSLRGEDAPLVLGLVGEPGTGRSTELAALAARRGAGTRPAPTVWLRGADLRPGDGGIKDAVERALRAAARVVGATGPGRAADPLTAAPVDDPTGPVAALARAADRPLLVLLDAPEEMPPVLAHALPDWVAGTARWLRATRTRLVVAARPEFWEQAGAAVPTELLFAADGGAGGRPLPPCVRLDDLGPAEAARARERHGLPERALGAADAAHPLTLRLMAEVRTAMGAGPDEEGARAAGEVGVEGELLGRGASGGGFPGRGVRTTMGAGLDGEGARPVGEPEAEGELLGEETPDWGFPGRGVRSGFGVGPCGAGEGRAEGEPPGRKAPSREEVFSAHLDLVCLRIALRLARVTDPPPHGAGVRRLAARVSGRVHEAARRCLGPGQGELDREAFEELFPWRTGWASAVLSEGLLVPAGAGYRFAHEEAADWLQSLHLDLPTALDALVHRWCTPNAHPPARPPSRLAPPADGPDEAPVRLPARAGKRAGQPPPVPPAPAVGPTGYPRSLPVPRHRAGPVVQALLHTPPDVLARHLAALVEVLDEGPAAFPEQPPPPPGYAPEDAQEPVRPPATGPVRASDRAPSAMPAAVPTPAPAPSPAAGRPTAHSRAEAGPDPYLGTAGDLAADADLSAGLDTVLDLDTELDTDTVPMPGPRRPARPATPAGGVPARRVEAGWWAAHLLRETLLRVEDTAPYREVLRALAGRIVVRAVAVGGFGPQRLGGLGEFGPWFWRRVPLPAADRLELVRLLLPADGPPPGSGPVPGFAPGPAGGLVPGPVSGGVPSPMGEPLPGAAYGVASGVVPGPVPGLAPGPADGGVPGPVPGGVPSLTGGPLPGPVPGPVTGGMPGLADGLVPGLGDGVARGLVPGAAYEVVPGPVPGPACAPAPGFAPVPAGGPVPRPAGTHDRFLGAAAELLRADPAAALPVVCGWFADDRPLQAAPGGPRLTVASAAQALLHTHRRLAVDDLAEALVTAAHPGADAVLAALAEDEPSAVCRAVDRWAHDPRPERHVAAAAYGALTAPFVRSRADRELLRYAALTLLARPGERALHGAALGLLVRDPTTRARYLPAALEAFAAGEAGLPAGAMTAALRTDPEAVLGAFRARLRGTRDPADAGDVLAELAAITEPGTARRVGALVEDYLRARPQGAPAVARYLDLRLEQGPGARPALLPLAAALLRDHPSSVRSALVPVLAAPGSPPSRALRHELLDAALDAERDLDVLDALLTAAAEGATARHPLLTRDLVHRLALLLGRTPHGAARFDRRTVALATAHPHFARLLRGWLADVHPWDTLLGPSARRTLTAAAPRATPPPRAASFPAPRPAPSPPAPAPAPHPSP